MESYLNVVVHDRQDAVVLAVSGELDIVSSPRLQEAIRSLAPTRRQRLILDLADLEFMDVSGVRVLVGAQTLASRMGAGLALVNVGRSVRRVLALTGADDLLSAAEDP